MNAPPIYNELIVSFTVFMLSFISYEKILKESFLSN